MKWVGENEYKDSDGLYLQDPSWFIRADDLWEQDEWGYWRMAGRWGCWFFIFEMSFGFTVCLFFQVLLEVSRENGGFLLIVCLIFFCGFSGLLQFSCSHGLFVIYLVAPVIMRTRIYSSGIHQFLVKTCSDISICCFYL